MKFAKCVIMLLFLVTSYTVNAKEEIKSNNPPRIVTRPVTLFGLRTCKDWNDAKQKSEQISGNDGSNMVRLAHQTWLAGYLTGLNMASTQPNLLRDLDLDTVTEWVDKHCAEHPADSVINAVDSMFRKLHREEY
jgi:hypothetical protein